MRKAKAGRNDPCLCGSGKKYKKCCGSKMQDKLNQNQIDVPAIQRKLQEISFKEMQREKTFGKINPVVHGDFKGFKFTAVGNEIHWEQLDKRKTFIDFLLYYPAYVFNKDSNGNWGTSELQKPLEDRHVVLKWYDGIKRFQSELLKNEKGFYEAAPNGVMFSYLLIAYDLYILRHHQSFQDSIVNRLKHQDQFQGARYELYVAAACIKAGFDVEYENEKDNENKHPELVAVHRVTKQKFCVEAKSRHRENVLGYRRKTREQVSVGTEIADILTRAYEKRKKFNEKICNPYVIFIDLNLHPSHGHLSLKPFFGEVFETLGKLRQQWQTESKASPFNLLVITNYAFYYREDGEPYVEEAPFMYVPSNPEINLEHPEALNDLMEQIKKPIVMPVDFPEKN